MIMVAIHSPPDAWALLHAWPRSSCILTYVTIILRSPGGTLATPEDRSMAVRLEREGSVGVIVLDRPPANSYDYEFLKEFGAAVDDARVDDGIRAVVVRSASERFFSAGADLKAFEAGSQRRRAMTVLLGHEGVRKM